MSLDLDLFKEHVKSADFQIGVDSGRWDIDSEPGFSEWPHVVIWVQATGKPQCPNRYHFRFLVDGYSQKAPNALPWDNENDKPLALEEWPNGGVRVNSVFNPSWKPNALYCPCDRVAMVGHETWKERHPDLWWNSESTITLYLDLLHQLLNSNEYANS
ncbi:MAG: hypothetical protein JKY52_12835 [Flavobacteriales bacterium]|nr:hypothetical protein [Flavobacteriales bacterium]